MKGKGQEEKEKTSRSVPAFFCSRDILAQSPAWTCSSCLASEVCSWADKVFQRNARLARGTSETAVGVAVEAQRRWVARRAGRARLRSIVWSRWRDGGEKKEMSKWRFRAPCLCRVNLYSAGALRKTENNMYTSPDFKESICIHWK